MSAEDTQKSWSEKVAGWGVDMLVDHGLIKKQDFERATGIMAEEILVRLAIGDYPPPEKNELSQNDASYEGSSVKH
jgi:hypothetical protein